MTQLSLVGFRPLRRFPPVVDPWTEAQIQESAAPDGPWVTIETIDPLDPAALPLDAPPSYSFTTNAATLEDGWYRVLFLDAVGSEGPTEPVSRDGQRVALPPSPNQVRLRSRLLATLYPEDPLSAEVEALLGDAVRDAVVLVESLTCRTLDATLAQDRQLGRLALRAVVLKAEQFGVRSSVKSSQTMAAGQLLRSISAGPWSESYFGPEEAAKAKVLDPNPALHEVLWALATEECREKWLELWTGEYAPGAVVQTFNWRRTRAPQMRGY